MRATDFEFRHRFWIITLVFVAAFYAYGIDHVNTGVMVGGWIMGHSINFRAPSDRRLMQGVFAFAGFLTFLAVLIRTWGAAYLQSDVVHDPNLHAEGLVADGPYRHVRNPLYLGGDFLSAGFGIVTSRLGFLILLLGLWIFYYRLILREEAELLAAQGEAYRRFTEKVPRLWPSLLPRLPASGMKPRWGQAFLGEAPMWLLASSVWAYSFTLSTHVLFPIIAVALAAYIIREFVIRRQEKTPASKPTA